MEINPETSFLASLLANPAEGFTEIDKHGITVEDFTGLASRALALELLKMRDDNSVISEITLANRLPEKHRNTPFEILGECGYQPADYWALELVKGTKRRQVAAIGETLKRLASDPETDLEQTIDKALAGLTQTQDKGLVSKSETLKEAGARVIADLDNPPSFIATPWPALNEVIRGLRPGALYTLGARTGLGKSLVALQLATGISSPNCQVAYFSFEMNNTEQVNRALSALTGISSTKIAEKDLTPAQKETVRAAQRELTNSLHLLGSPSRDVSQLRPQLRAINSNSEGKLGAIVVDYLQLMQAPAKETRDRVSIASNQLKSLAMEFNLPIVALSQLNRESAKRGGLPGVTDLAESSAIEQDSDVVILLSDDPDNTERGRVKLQISKNRHGEKAMFTGLIDGRSMTLKELKQVGAWPKELDPERDY